MKFNKSTMALNCDLGEGLDHIDAQIMPFIDCANIACGGHAGDLTSMARTLRLAKQHKVIIGAHPAYPDRKNFGRESLIMSNEKLIASLIEQIAALNDLAEAIGMDLAYIKPHGALYNDCIRTANNALDCTIATAKHFNLPLMLLAGNKHIMQACQEQSVELITEAFADRGYLADGSLVPRSQTMGLLNKEQASLQVKNLRERNGLSSITGEWLELSADSVCVHSDTPSAITTIKALRANQ